MTQAQTCAFFIQDFDGRTAAPLLSELFAVCIWISFRVAGQGGVLKAGNHVLSVKVKEGVDKYMSIAHVIWW